MNSIIEKKCQVLLLKTDNKENSLIQFGRSLRTSLTNLTELAVNRVHIYIISDDKIEINDYVYDNYRKVILQAVDKENTDFFNLTPSRYKKIIATTDESLILSNNTIMARLLPQPSPQFITKFIESYNKGNVISDVIVEYEQGKSYSGNEGLIIKEWLKVNFKDNTITIKKLKDSWNKFEHIGNLIKYREDYEEFKKNCHFGPNQKEIEEWSINWISNNL
jgi:hypothetical protein